MQRTYAECLLALEDELATLGEGTQLEAMKALHQYLLQAEGEDIQHTLGRLLCYTDAMHSEVAWLLGKTVVTLSDETLELLRQFKDASGKQTLLQRVLFESMRNTVIKRGV